jgi:hypothetical protein
MFLFLVLSFYDIDFMFQFFYVWTDINYCWKTGLDLRISWNISWNAFTLCFIFSWFFLLRFSFSSSVSFFHFISLWCWSLTTKFVCSFYTHTKKSNLYHATNIISNNFNSNIWCDCWCIFNLENSVTKIYVWFVIFF